MSRTTRPRTAGRFRSLVGGFLRRWVRGRERRSPELVYEQAIAERVRQYRELKRAVAGILALRNRLDAEIHERRAEIARLHDDARRAVRRGQDRVSLALIERKQALFEDLERAERDLAELRTQAGEAKNNLVRFREEIRSLMREKGRMLATLANLQARRRLQAAIEGLSVDVEMDALENVREHIARLDEEGRLGHELGDEGDDLRSRIRAFRDEGRREAARIELEQLKHALANHVLTPASMPRPEPVPAG